MAEAKEREKGIFLLMDENVVANFLNNTVFPVMNVRFPIEKFVAILIEDGDDLEDLLQTCEPTVFIFDAELDFIGVGQSCSSYDLMQRLVRKYEQAFGMMCTSKKVFGSKGGFQRGKGDDHHSNIRWFPKVGQENNGRPGIAGVDKVLQRVFKSL